jgi:hypothetical protein
MQYLKESGFSQTDQTTHGLANHASSHPTIFAMRKICVLLFTCAAIQVSAQSVGSRPSFTDFKVTHVYHGAPAPPKLTTARQRTFRTMIRDGAKQKVEFAGHYTVPKWGCGTSCVSFAIADSISGKVYDTPFEAVSELPGAWFDEHPTKSSDWFEWHPNSRLMKIDGCPNERDCGFYDYVMVDGEGLRLIRKELLPAEFQPAVPR